jgi:hypothetical protein
VFYFFFLPIDAVEETVALGFIPTFTPFVEAPDALLGAVDFDVFGLPAMFLKFKLLIKNI